MKRFRIYFRALGGHIHVRWFGSGQNGELVFSPDEWAIVYSRLARDTDVYLLIDEQETRGDLQT